MKEKIVFDARDIMNRIKAIENLSSDTQLAALLNINRNTMATWSTRNTIDYEAIVRYCIETGSDISEIVTGMPGTNEKINKDLHADFKTSIPVVTIPEGTRYNSKVSSPDYITNLPTVVVLYLNPGEYRGFEMNENTEPYWSRGDIFIGRMVTDISEITNNWKLYLVIRKDGIKLQGIIFNDFENKKLKLIYGWLALSYGNLQELDIPYEEIFEIWKHERSIVTEPGIGLDNDPGYLKIKIEHNKAIYDHNKKIMDWQLKQIKPL